MAEVDGSTVSQAILLVDRQVVKQRRPTERLLQIRSKVSWTNAAVVAEREFTLP